MNSLLLRYPGLLKTNDLSRKTPFGKFDTEIECALIQGACRYGSRELESLKFFLEINFFFIFFLSETRLTSRSYSAPRISAHSISFLNFPMGVLRDNSLVFLDLDSGRKETFYSIDSLLGSTT